jgi:aspartate kinase
MATIAMKFGGTSVADIERIRHVAGLVKREVERGNKVAVVVSAMAGETNKLVAWTNDAAKPESSNQATVPDQREYDVVVPAREQVTAGFGRSPSTPWG